MGRKSLRLHPRYGLNPTIPKCFFCDEDKNEIALLADNYKGEAPSRGLTLDYEPCETCKGHFNEGVALIETEQEPILGPDQPPITSPRIFPALYPTGRWLVMHSEAVSRIFKPEVARGMLRVRKALIDVKCFDAITLNATVNTETVQ